MPTKNNFAFQGAVPVFGISTREIPAQGKRAPREMPAACGGLDSA